VQLKGHAHFELAILGSPCGREQLKGHAQF
jgi:hypothetical protein